MKLLGLLFLTPMLSFGACNLSFPTLDAGLYNPLSPVATQSSSYIQVICETRQNVTVRINSGRSNNIYNRYMIGPGFDTLYYNIYQDPTRTLVFGNGINSGYYSGENGIIPLFLLIPARQVVSRGFYSDNLLIELNY